MKSLTDQYSRRRTLSPRQLVALKRVLLTYRDQIPGFDEAAEKLGIKDAAAGKGRRKGRGAEKSEEGDGAEAES